MTKISPELSRGGLLCTYRRMVHVLFEDIESI